MTVFTADLHKDLKQYIICKWEENINTSYNSVIFPAVKNQFSKLLGHCCFLFQLYLSTVISCIMILSFCLSDFQTDRSRGCDDVWWKAQICKLYKGAAECNFNLVLIYLHTWKRVQDRAAPCDMNWFRWEHLTH